MGTAVLETTAKKKSKKLWQPYVTDMCTGCGGKPVCKVYCKFDAISLEDDTENYPFKKARIDELLCTGCRSCISKGKQGIMLTGCPFNAIRLKEVKSE
ncbi:MAG: 4Fe-4S dicluster domain-containing protein [Proteobacteria bacterium]|nr:4Fe-4S dicluster domain-containing protein [Pseudomonadota bacterium]